MYQKEMIDKNWFDLPTDFRKSKINNKHIELYANRLKLNGTWWKDVTRTSINGRGKY